VFFLSSRLYIWENRDHNFGFPSFSSIDFSTEPSYGRAKYAFLEQMTTVSSGELFCIKEEHLPAVHQTVCSYPQAGEGGTACKY
jgi:hypothetical protein